MKATTTATIITAANKVVGYTANRDAAVIELRCAISTAWEEFEKTAGAAKRFREEMVSLLTSDKVCILHETWDMDNGKQKAYERKVFSVSYINDLVLAVDPRKAEDGGLRLRGERSDKGTTAKVEKFDVAAITAAAKALEYSAKDIAALLKVLRA